jgi:hypothetical protein
MSDKWTTPDSARLDEDARPASSPDRPTLEPWRARTTSPHGSRYRDRGPSQRSALISQPRPERR